MKTEIAREVLSEARDCAEAQRPHTKEVTEGCRKRPASEAAALLPGGLQRQKEQHVRGWWASAKPRRHGLRPHQRADPVSHCIAIHNVGSV